MQAVAGQVLPKLFNPDIEDMAQDSGAIFQKGVRKLAIYKDESDQVHTHSAVCPHLGCLIQVKTVTPPLRSSSELPETSLCLPRMKSGWGNCWNFCEVWR